MRSRSLGLLIKLEVLLVLYLFFFTCSGWLPSQLDEHPDPNGPSQGAVAQRLKRKSLPVLI